MPTIHCTIFESSTPAELHYTDDDISELQLHDGTLVIYPPDDHETEPVEYDLADIHRLSVSKEDGIAANGDLERHIEQLAIDDEY